MRGRPVRGRPTESSAGRSSGWCPTRTVPGFIARPTSTKSVAPSSNGMDDAGAGRRGGYAARRRGACQWAAKLGLNSIPVIVARSWSEEEKRAYRLADNQLAARASWDPEQLRNELRELESAGFDVDLIGFDPDQLETILATLGSSGLTDPDSVPEVLDQPVAGVGDIWQLGDHRVGCGDSTIAADVASVLAGSAPHLMIADPPYGVSYEPSWRARRKLIYGGAAGGGKTVGLILEPLRHVGRIANFTAVFFRRTTPQITNPGALWDESLNFYRWVGGTPHVGVHEWRWPRAGKIKFSHLQLESTVYDWQGAQITLICFDELTQFTAHQFFYMVSRNRSTCGVRPLSVRRATRTPTVGSPSSWHGGLTRRPGSRSPSGPAFCAITSASRARSFGPIGPKI